MGASGTGYPLLPAGYVAGTITLPDGNPHNLLTLIQTQLDPNCKGAAQQVGLQADDSGNLYVGRNSLLGGPLSTTNYGYVLQSGAQTYRTSFPGDKAPIGDLEVLMDGGGTFHVEVT